MIIQRYYFKATGGKRFFRMAPLHHHFELKGMARNGGGDALLDHVDRVRAGRARAIAETAAALMESMELAGKRVMVVGLGVSGLAAARFLAARGAHLVMTDRRDRISIARKLAAWRSCISAPKIRPGWTDSIWS